MKMKLNLLLLFAVLLTAHPISGQELLTLDDAIAIALKNNQWIQVSKNNAAIANNNAHIGNAGMLPKVDFSSGVNYNDNQMQSELGAIDDISTITNAGVTASLTLFNGFGNLYTFKKLKSSAEIGELSARYNIENELLNIINGYYVLARSSEKLTIARESVTISKDRYQRTKNRGMFGQANKIAVLNAEVDLNADSVAYYNAVLSYDEAGRNLNVLLNRNIDFDYIVDSEVEFTETYILNDLQQKVLDANASYLMTVNNLKQAKYDLRISQSSYLPRLSLQSSYGYNQAANNFDVQLHDPNKSFTAGATMRLNLFDGFQKSIKRQNAKLQIENQKLLLEDARLNLDKELKNTYASYQNSRYILEVQQRNLLSAQLNFERTRDLYDLGQVTSTQFREAQLNLIRSKTDISNAKFDAKLYEFQLLKLVGELVQIENFD